MPFKVAVIGGGAGGASAAYFLRSLLGPRVHIDIFEKSSRIGGRTSVAEFKGHYVEAGGTYIHESNTYMTEFVNKLGLKRYKAMDAPGSLGIFNGKEFGFIQSKHSYINKLKMIFRYGLKSVRRLERSLSQVLKQFGTIYDLQNEGKYFRTVPDMLYAMGGEEFLSLTQMTAEESMQNDGIDELLIKELLVGNTSWIYGQGSNINAFTGYLCMAGTPDALLYSIKGGNHQLCEKLIFYSHANVHTNSRIESIRKETREGKLKYVLSTSDESTLNTSYDAILVATPLQVPGCYIACEESSSWPKKESLQQYSKRVVTILQGNLNRRYFSCGKGVSLANIFTTEQSNLSIESIVMQKNVLGEELKPPLQKIFSSCELEKKTIDELFENISMADSIVAHWSACPQYHLPVKYVPFILDNGAFYVNAIEEAATGLEMSCIGARNAAWLTKYYLDDRL